MGGIPLPALDARVPQSPDAAEQMGRLVQMKGLINQQQIQQQQMQAGALENQQRQMDLDSQKALQKAYMDAQGDPDQTEKLAARYGAKPTALLEWHKAVTAQKLQALDLYTKQGDVAKQQADLVQGSHDMVSAAAPEQRPQVYQQELQGLQTRGIDTSKMPQQYPGDDAFKMIGLGIKTHTQLLDEAAKTAQMGKENAQAGEARANQAKNEAESAWYAKNGGAPGVPTEAVQAADWLRKNPGKSPSDYVVWKAQHSPTMLMQGGFGQPNDPAIDMVGQHGMDLATALQRVSPAAKDAFLKNLSAKYPDFDQGAYKRENAAATKATSGSWADTRVAYNTAIDHANQLLTASDALKNGDIRKLSQLKNYFKTEFGDPDVSNFQAIANAYNHEVTSVVSKGHITDSEVAQGHGVLPDNASPEQIRGVAQAYKALMTSKRDELDKVIKAGAHDKADSVLKVGASDATPKTLSMSALQQAAKDHGVSVDEARRQAIAAGYKIQ